MSLYRHLSRLPSRPASLLFLFTTAFCGTCLGFWLQEPLSARELVANMAKSVDYFAAAFNTGGIPWWTPSYNMGQSLAPQFASIFGAFCLMLGAYVGGDLFHDPAKGIKVLCILFMALSAGSMFFFVRRLTNCGWMALAAGIIYLTCPQLTMKMARAEHLALGMAYVFPPLALLSVLILSKSRSWFHVLLLALSCAAMTLIFVRTAAGFAPLILLFAIWLAMHEPNALRHLLWGIPRAVGIFFFLGVLPVLPMLRESPWLSMFRYDPMTGWQQSFSFKSAISWLDRLTEFAQGPAGIATRGGSPFYSLDEGTFYLGIVPLIVLAVLFLGRGKIRDLLDHTVEGSLLRLFIGCHFLLTWLSAGPKSIFSGHFSYLSDAFNMPNWAAVAANLLILIQLYLLYRILPANRWRTPLSILLGMVYLFVPAFKIITLFPPYDNIRAPWVFWEMSGSVCLAAMGGIGLVVLLRHFFSLALQKVVGVLMLLLLLVDWHPYHAYFGKGGLESSLLQHFHETEQFLAKAPRPGRVAFYSGRYFYLLTPMLSNRGLSGEAFMSYFTPIWTKEMFIAGSASPDASTIQTSFMGITYIVAEKTDPDTPPQLIQAQHMLYPIVYENEHFIVFENPNSLAPCSYGQEIVAVLDDSPQARENIVTLARLRFAPISVTGVDNSDPAIVGIVDRNGIHMSEPYKNRAGQGFMISPLPIDQRDPQTIHIPPPPGGSTITVVPQSYHPDWKAYANGQPAEVVKAFGCLLGVRVNPQVQIASLFFKFEPPLWYNLVAWATLFSWLLAIAALISLLLGDYLRSGHIFGSDKTEKKTLPENDLTPHTSAIVLQKKLLAIPPNVKISEGLLFFAKAREIVPDLEAVFLVSGRNQRDAFEKLRTSPLVSQCFVVTADKNPLQSLFQWCTASHIDALFLLPMDGSYPVSSMLSALQTLSRGAEVAVGSRYLDGIRVNGWPLHRLLFSQLAASMTRIALGLDLTDPRSGCVVLNRTVIEVLSQMHFYQPPNSGEWLGVLQAVSYAGLVVDEFPLSYDETNPENASLSLQPIVKSVIRLIRLAFFRLRIQS